MREVEQEIISRRPEHSVDLALDRMADLVRLLGDPQRMAGEMHAADAVLAKKHCSPQELLERIKIMSARKRGPRLPCERKVRWWRCRYLIWREYHIDPLISANPITERLINVGDELIARQILHRRVVHQLLLERQVPVLIPLVPPQILQPAPELVGLLDPPNLLPPRNLRLRPKLHHQPPQSLLQPLRQQLVVQAISRNRSRAASAGTRRTRSAMLRASGASLSRILPHGSIDRHNSRISLRQFRVFSHSSLA